MLNYSILPTANAVKAARVYLGYTQDEFAKKCKMHTHILSTVETKKYNTTKETLMKIAKVFWNEGLYFLPEGGFRMDKNIVTIYEGENCYLQLVDNILKDCSTGATKEVLFLGSDDRKSNKKVIEKDALLYKAGLDIKNLVEEKNDYALGPLEDYRQINKNNLLSNNVVVIYGDKVAFPSIINKKGISTKTIVINDPGIANQLKTYFYHLWKKGKKIKKSKTKQVLFKKQK